MLTWLTSRDWSTIVGSLRTHCPVLGGHLDPNLTIDPEIPEKKIDTLDAVLFPPLGPPVIAIVDEIALE